MGGLSLRFNFNVKYSAHLGFTSLTTFLLRQNGIPPRHYVHSSLDESYTLMNIPHYERLSTINEQNPNLQLPGTPYNGVDFTMAILYLARL
jgi:hypothetical protein